MYLQVTWRKLSMIQEQRALVRVVMYDILRTLCRLTVEPVIRIWNSTGDEERGGEGGREGERGREPIYNHVYKLHTPHTHTPINTTQATDTRYVCTQYTDTRTCLQRAAHACIYQITQYHWPIIIQYGLYSLDIKYWQTNYSVLNGLV